MGVRVMLGKLDAITGLVGDFGLWVGRGILGTGTNTTIDNDGLAVTASGVERVRIGAIGGSDYGLKVTNAGSTVVIDGTSNHFKIVSSGTDSVTQGAGTSGYSEITHTGLGTWATIPMVVSAVGFSSAVSTSRQLGSDAWNDLLYAADTSAGSPTNRTITLSRLASMSFLLDGSSQLVTRFVLVNEYTASDTAYCRYHVCKEAAL